MTIPLHTQIAELTRVLKRLNAAEYNSVAISTAATMLDTSRSTVNRMIGDGELAAFRLGGEKRILVSSIAEYVGKNRIGDKKASTISVVPSSMKAENKIAKIQKLSTANPHHQTGDVCQG